ncbi:MAG: hypothetical protein QOJ65_1157, partial [Fimbriimonadaceae bacterium]|nr:hypothetical protein [Fimbriimonadaceae bacterium]
MQIRLVAFGVVFFAGASLGFGQIKIGGARLTGLAGAGLALPYRAGQVVYNPGLFARNRKVAKFHGPYLDYYTRGLSFGAFQDLLGSTSGGGLETQNFGRLARRFAGGRKELGAVGEAGATLGGVYVGYRAEASAATLPNDELKRWENESGDPATLGTTYSGAGLDGYGYAYDAVEFGYGMPFQQPGGTWNVGAKLKN